MAAHDAPSSSRKNTERLRMRTENGRTMSTRKVTIELPVQVYDEIERAAERAHRPVGDVMIEALMAAGPMTGQEDDRSRSAVAHLAYLNDAALWQAARSSMTPKQRERLEELHIEQQSRPLTDAEWTEEQALVKLYRETILLRARAAAILKQRGYDISDPEQFTPLV